MSKRILSVSTAALAFLLAVGLAGVAQAGPTAVCGDGLIEGSEFCDDSNTVDGDGCSSACQFEICGDGVVDPVSEECDTGALCEDNTTDCTEVSTPGMPGGPNDPGMVCSVDCAPRSDVGDGCDANCMFECGNGTIQAPEECDDGGRVDGDGCDANCINEICGNGVLQPGAGEQCDDGNTVDGDGCSSTCQDEMPPAPLSKDQQKCVNAVNKGAEKISKTQNKEITKCQKDKAKGKLAGTFDACLTADSKGKIGKASAKLDAKSVKACDPLDPPGFAYIADNAAVTMAATDHPVALALAIFGDPADGNINAGKDESKCQGEVLKGAAKLYDTLIKEWNKAKKQQIKGSKTITSVTTGAELSNALQNVPTGSSKVQKTAQKLTTKAAKKCAGLDSAALFPGACTNADLNLVVQCVTQRAACEACLQLNESDGLSIDCDLVDDDTANASCPAP